MDQGFLFIFCLQDSKSFYKFATMKILGFLLMIASMPFLSIGGFFFYLANLCLYKDENE